MTWGDKIVVFTGADEGLKSERIEKSRNKEDEKPWSKENVKVTNKVPKWNIPFFSELGVT